MLCAGSDPVHLLAILERPGPQDLAMAFPGSAVLRSEQSLTLSAAEHLICVSGTAIHRSREAVLEYGETVARGQRLQAHFETIHLVGRLFTTLVQNLVHKANAYFRHTEELDQVKAGQLARETTGLYSLDSQYTVLISAKDTKIDGERIHMG